MRANNTLCAIFLLFLLHQFVFAAEEQDLAWKWGDRAYKLCTKHIKNKVKKGTCEDFRDLVIETFDVMGINMANAVGSSTHNELFQRAETEPWKSAGLADIEQVVLWIGETKPKKAEKIKEELNSKLMGWLLKLVAGDSSGLNFRPNNLDFSKLNIPGNGQPVDIKLPDEL